MSIRISEILSNPACIVFLNERPPQGQTLAENSRVIDETGVEQSVVLFKPVTPTISVGGESSVLTTAISKEAVIVGAKVHGADCQGQVFNGLPSQSKTDSVWITNPTKFVLHVTHTCDNIFLSVGYR